MENDEASLNERILKDSNVSFDFADRVSFYIPIRILFRFKIEIIICVMGRKGYKGKKTKKM